MEANLGVANMMDHQSLAIPLLATSAAATPPPATPPAAAAPAVSAASQRLAAANEWWERKLGLWSAVFNLSTTSIGAGIMALPATMKILGLPLGLLLILFMGLLTDVSVKIIVRFAIATQTSSYGQLMGVKFGEFGRILTEVFVILQALGSLVVYLILFGDVLSGTAPSSSASSPSVHHEGVLEQWAGGPTWWTSRTFVILFIALLLLLPLVSLREIDSLMPTSAVSVLLAAFFVIFTAAAAIMKFFSGQMERPKMLPDLGYPQVLEIFTVIPVMSNAFICHYNVQPIYDELRHPSEKRMVKAAWISQLICTAVYSSTALFCFLLFAQSTSSDVLANYDSDLGLTQALDDMVRIGYVLHLLLVFPIVHFPLRLAADTLLFPNADTPLANDTWRFYMVTSVTMGLIVFLGLVVPDIYVLFSFSGAIVGVSIGFTLPALLALRGRHIVELDARDTKYVWAMLILGILVSCTGLLTDVIQLVQ